MKVKQGDIDVIREIGKGVYGDVFLGLTPDGAHVAIKRSKLEIGIISSSFMRETFILQRLTHENVIKMYSSYIDQHCYLIMEYIPESLFDAIARVDPKSMLRQLLEGIQYIHDEGFLHRDIKPQNIMIDTDGVLKYIDFGMTCRLYAIDKSCVVITRWYRPPELFLGVDDYGTEVDIWSIGCVFAELLLQRALLPGKSSSEQLKKIFKLCGTENKAYQSFIHNTKSLSHSIDIPITYDSFDELDINCKHAVDILRCMLNCNPKDRISSKTALEHNYLS
jgi:serine/threonine protein kinase